MNNAGLKKEEILLMLEEISNELAKLENDLHRSLSELNNDWITSRESQLAQCSRRLSNLEEKLEGLGQRDVAAAFEHQQGMKLELGY
ncbi:hypothetical protein [Bacillus sp. T33-2]|uniref:hypothetical protein n=1 Tax=Bacillus sp. T33-2 TaxID=2054168 RepID=UPI000C773F1F|nr:hypothetical protein [Bacillus sp. T33-2]PLR99709.1 hypothetical protein CVD19_01225 [Bacillus sp. T33-2]